MANDMTTTMANDMTRIIRVKIRQVYGKDMVYPVCNEGKLLCKLAGTTTITGQMISILQSLDYKLEIEPQSL